MIFQMPFKCIITDMFQSVKKNIFFITVGLKVMIFRSVTDA